MAIVSSGSQRHRGPRAARLCRCREPRGRARGRRCTGRHLGVPGLERVHRSHPDSADPRHGPECRVPSARGVADALRMKRPVLPGHRPAGGRGFQTAGSTCHAWTRGVGRAKSAPGFTVHVGAARELASPRCTGISWLQPRNISAQVSGSEGPQMGRASRSAAPTATAEVANRHAIRPAREAEPRGSPGRQAADRSRILLPDPKARPTMWVTAWATSSAGLVGVRKSASSRARPGRAVGTAGRCSAS